MGLMTDYKPESKYLKAEDLATHNWEWTLTITGVGEAQFNDGRRQPTLSFKETDKVLGLNKTNLASLAEMFGKPNAQGFMDVDAPDLVGKVVTAFKSRTQNSTGSMVDCVRLRFPRVAAYNMATGTPPPAPEQFTAEQQAAASAALMWLDSLNMQGLTKADADAAKAHGVAIGANLTGVTTLKGGIDAVRKRAQQIADSLTISKTEDIPF